MGTNRTLAAPINEKLLVAGEETADTGRPWHVPLQNTAPMFLSAMGKLVASTNPHTLPPAGYLSACSPALYQYRSRVLPAQLGLSMAYCYHSICIRDGQDVAVSPNPRHVTLQIWAAPVHPWGNPVLLLRGGRGSDADSSSSDRGTGRVLFPSVRNRYL